MSFINRIMPRWRALAPPERSKWLLGLDTAHGYAQDCISILWHFMVPVESHETHCDANHRSLETDRFVKKKQDFKTYVYGTVTSPTCILCVLNKQTCDQCRNRRKNEIRDMDQCQAQLTRTIEYVAWGWVGLGAPDAR